MPPARAVILLLLIVRMHTVCFGLRGPRPSCNCVICVVLILSPRISVNSNSLKLTVYCDCEAAKPNSQCLLYFNTRVVVIEPALNSLSNGTNILIFMKIKVRLVKLGGDANSRNTAPFLTALIAGF